ncbi:MAG: ribosome maturation factor RimM [Rickettsiales bacterium]|jgi:16S rRNA processing protein RimM|nr:ribosome maturation factor RimM [Rickettsiales bacterium]
MSDASKILVGKIVAAHGLRGQVRVQTYAENPLDFQKFQVQSPRFPDGGLAFVRHVPNSDVIVAKIDGVDDRIAAEALRGTELFIERESLPRLPVGEYYQTDLIGMQVNLFGKMVGAVAAVHNFGAGDILESDSGEMLSFGGADVDMENKIIYIK